MKIAIIGTGFSGLGAAITLLNSGYKDITLFEKNNSPGGTWHENTYPGCACDIASNLYSYSFFPNPNWSEKYAPQKEIGDYINQCINQFTLDQHIKYNISVSKCAFENKQWTLFDQESKLGTYDLLILGTGPLNRTYTPFFKGFDTYKGHIIHSAKWDHSIDFSGKKVAIIGTGASSIQIIPELAKQVDQLCIFQRTAPWVIRRRNKTISDQKKELYHRYPLLQKLKRQFTFLKNELTLLFFNIDWLNELFRKSAIKEICHKVTDEELLKNVIPDYKVGCKRILKSDDYYETLQLPNVELITDSIDQFTSTGISSPTKERPFDIIINCTGFSASDFIPEIEIVAHQKKLSEQWRSLATAYKGICISGFPNLLYMMGPNTGLGHNSIIHIIESQCKFIQKYVKQLSKRKTLDVKALVQEKYNSWLQLKLRNTIWQKTCTSWYKNKDQINTVLWPKSAISYRRLMKRFDKNHFE